MELKEILSHHIPDHVYFALNMAGLNLPITKHLLMMWLSGGIILLVATLAYRLNFPAARLLRAAIEAMVIFIRENVVAENMGEEGKKYSSYFCTLFAFILVCNLAGLVPYGATATSNIAVTGALALTTFGLINIAGIRAQGAGKYIASIVPSGVPVWIYPGLFVVEVFGLFTKAFALCVRLFANMLAGHIVILCFIGLIFMFGKISAILGAAVIIPAVAMALFALCLEILVAILQAYIFTFLTAVFAGAAVNSH
ncbi:MAG: F0F1 ATP synthase subunit A [Elusimicrobia bacterium]|nr:F0F1 ATP synthase subunit A [Elusimicrobiota bacterium]